MLAKRSTHLANGIDELAGRRSEAAARRPDPTPEAERGGTDPDRARDAGIDAAVLDRLLGGMEPDDRASIRKLCARDLETTRRNARQALREGDGRALARHLHVMSSLAQTIGAGALADATGWVQERMRSGAAEGPDDAARRMDELARRAAGFLSEGRG